MTLAYGGSDGGAVEVEGALEVAIDVAVEGAVDVAVDEGCGGMGGAEEAVIGTGK